MYFSGCIVLQRYGAGAIKSCDRAGHMIRLRPTQLDSAPHSTQRLIIINMIILILGLSLLHTGGFASQFKFGFKHFEKDKDYFKYSTQFIE